MTSPEASASPCRASPRACAVRGAIQRAVAGRDRVERRTQRHGGVHHQPSLPRDLAERPPGGALQRLRAHPGKRQAQGVQPTRQQPHVPRRAVQQAYVFARGAETDGQFRALAERRGPLGLTRAGDAHARLEFGGRSLEQGGSVERGVDVELRQRSARGETCTDQSGAA